jgi:uncharacterized repeat protein (TIGR01451 family)
MRFRCSVALSPCLLIFALGSAAVAQLPAQPPKYEAVNGTAPLLYARFLGPAGMDATFFRGGEHGKSFPLPVTVGLRPGYIYRVELNNLPNRPGVQLFPTLEVIGTLRLPPRVRAKDYPAPIPLTTDDIEQVMAGAMITKVIYLEHPDKAVPITSDPDQPLETSFPAAHDLLREASDNGRPVIVLRLGQKEVSPEEMAREGLPGTILLPGETYLPLPRHKPVVAPVTWQWYDPLLGPRKPEEEYIYNGYINPNRGDPSYLSGLAPGLGRPPAMPGSERALLPGIDNQGRLQGLRSEDTVAEYTDSGGRRGVTISNRVCLVVPRFAVLRNELPPSVYDSVTGLADGRGISGQNLIRGGQPVWQTNAQDILKGFNGRQRPSGAIGQSVISGIFRLEALHADQIYLGSAALLGTDEIRKLTDIQRLRLARQIAFARSFTQAEHVSGFDLTTGPVVMARIEGGPEVIRVTTETRDVTSICLKEEPQAPDKPLVLIKWADCDSAKVGDVVTFFLRYSALGHRPLTDIAVSDSLTTRLEYIPGSAQSNRPAVFTMQENEAGSMILRWEITGKLQPGDTGVIRFQAKVR